MPEDTQELVFACRYACLGDHIYVGGLAQKTSHSVDSVDVQGLS